MILQIVCLCVFHRMKFDFTSFSVLWGVNGPGEKERSRRARDREKSHIDLLVFSTKRHHGVFCDKQHLNISTSNQHLSQSTCVCVFVCQRLCLCVRACDFFEIKKKKQELNVVTIHFDSFVQFNCIHDFESNGNFVRQNKKNGQNGILWPQNFYLCKMKLYKKEMNLIVASFFDCMA